MAGALSEPLPYYLGSPCSSASGRLPLNTGRTHKVTNRTDYLVDRRTYLAGAALATASVVALPHGADVQSHPETAPMNNDLAADETNIA